MKITKLFAGFLIIGITLNMIGCKNNTTHETDNAIVEETDLDEADLDEADKEIIEEVKNEPEIITPTESVEPMTPQENVEIEVEAGEEGAF